MWHCNRFECNTVHLQTFTLLCALQVVKRRHTLGRSVKSLRPSNRTRPTSLPIISPLTASAVEAGHSTFGLSNCSSSDLLNASAVDFTDLVSEPETVSIDVTGSNFNRQMAKSCNPIILCAGEYEKSADGMRDRKCIASWRRTICDPSDLVFYEIDADLPLAAFQIDAASASSTLTMTRSMTERSTLTLNFVKHRKSVSSRKTSCSWKQSLRSLIRGVRNKSTDLWATSQADSSPTYEQAATFRRSHSLPRSLKSQVADNEPFVKSKSMEGQLNVSLNSRTKSVTSSIHSAATLSRSRTSLLGRSRGRPKSMEVHIVSVDEFGKPCTGGGGGGGGSRHDNQMVHVNIPEQPWTKPFADVRLRTRATRTESEKYQSSSGKKWRECLQVITVLTKV